MKIDSAGILFVCENRCLLAHSTNSKLKGSWMPPKGGLESRETPEKAAIRETEEEIGWRVSPLLLNKSFDVLYTDKRERVYKTVRIFVIRIENEDPDKNGPLIKSVKGLQKEEIDQIRWFSSNEILEWALPRYQSYIINILNQSYKK